MIKYVYKSCSFRLFPPCHSVTQPGFFVPKRKHLKNNYDLYYTLILLTYLCSETAFLISYINQVVHIIYKIHQDFWNPQALPHNTMNNKINLQPHSHTKLILPTGLYNIDIILIFCNIFKYFLFFLSFLIFFITFAGDFLYCIQI